MKFTRYVIKDGDNLKVAEMIGTQPVSHIGTVPDHIPSSDHPYIKAEPVMVDGEISGYTISVDQDLKSAALAEIIAGHDDKVRAQLRQHRNALLSETDYTQLADSPLSAEKQQEFAEYRQALRDLPDNTDIHNPVFPTKPTED